MYNASHYAKFSVTLVFLAVIQMCIVTKATPAHHINVKCHANKLKVTKLVKPVITDQFHVTCYYSPQGQTHAQTHTYIWNQVCMLIIRDTHQNGLLYALNNNIS